MKVSIERKRPMIKKFFGGTKEADYESAIVTIEFSAEELKTIDENDLDDNMVYEHPEDKTDYDEGQQTARAHPNSYAGKNPPPRYQKSRFVRDFLDDPIQEVYPYLKTQIQFAEVQKSVENNLRDLKKVMEGIQSSPADKKNFEL